MFCCRVFGILNRRPAPRIRTIVVIAVVAVVIVSVVVVIQAIAVVITVTLYCDGSVISCGCVDCCH